MGALKSEFYLELVWHDDMNMKVFQVQKHQKLLLELIIDRLSPSPAFSYHL